MNSILLAFLLTCLAGLSTGIGSDIAFLTKHTNKISFRQSGFFRRCHEVYVSMMKFL